MKTFSIKCVLLFLCLIFFIQSFLNPDKVFSGNLNKPFDLRVKKIAFLNSSPIAQDIRKEFCDFVKIRTLHPEFPDHLPNITNAEQYISVLSKKLMVLEEELGPEPYGGVNLVIAVDPQKTRFFWVWAYNIGDDVHEEWDIKYIEEIFFDQERLVQLEQLRSNNYSLFWR